jgi:hypothetical protein
VATPARDHAGELLADGPFRGALVVPDDFGHVSLYEDGSISFVLGWTSVAAAASDLDAVWRGHAVAVDPPSSAG